MQMTSDSAPSGVPTPDEMPQTERFAAIVALPTADIGAVGRALALACAADVVAIFAIGPRGLRKVMANEHPADGWCTLRPGFVALARRISGAALVARSPIRHTLTGSTGSRSFIALPLAHASQFVGTIVLGTEHVALSDLHVMALNTIAPALAARIPQAPTTVASGDLATFFNAAADGALILDQQARIRAVNPAFTALTGWGQEIIGQHCGMVLGCQTTKRRVPCGGTGCQIATVMNGNRASTQIRTPNGQCQVLAGRVASGNRQLLLFAESDPAVHQRDDFISEVSHKIRNRMNSIKGFVELVASGHAGPVAPEQRELLSYAHSSSMELVEYMENLLCLTRTEVANPTLIVESVDPAYLLEEVEQHLAMEAESADIALVRDVPPGLPPVRGDRMRIRQVLLNLTMNAIKFTATGGVVRLEARRAEDGLIFTVADSGIGIAPIDQPHVFDRDYQSERTARSGKSGGGLGLAAAKAIVEQHGGMIWFTTLLDHGTTFFVRFPIPGPH